MMVFSDVGQVNICKIIHSIILARVFKTHMRVEHASPELNGQLLTFEMLLHYKSSTPASTANDTGSWDFLFYNR